MKPAVTLRVLVACESSGKVRAAFRALGHDAWSCDLLPADDGSPFHIQNDARYAANRPGMVAGLAQWDVLIGHPPCTYLTSAGLHWNKRRPERAAQTEEAIAFFLALVAAPIPFKAIENPIGCISTRYRKPDQIVQPWMFGADASKATCLWLEGLPTLVPTVALAGRMVTLANGKTVERWSNQTDSGQNRLPPSPDRWKLRSETYQGLADAMAEQWSAAAVAGTLARQRANYDARRAA